jgi:hypothetical protein
VLLQLSTAAPPRKIALPRATGVRDRDRPKMEDRFPRREPKLNGHRLTALILLRSCLLFMGSMCLGVIVSFFGEGGRLRSVRKVNGSEWEDEELKLTSLEAKFFYNGRTGCVVGGRRAAANINKGVSGLLHTTRT